MLLVTGQKVIILMEYLFLHFPAIMVAQHQFLQRLESNSRVTPSETLSLLNVLVVIVAREILNLVSKRKKIHCTLTTKHASNGCTLVFKPRTYVTRIPKYSEFRESDK